MIGCKEKCSDVKIRKMMGNLYKKEILFPPSIELLNKNGTDSVYWAKVNTKDPCYYIVHFFMSDCDKCIHELQNIQNFMNNHKKTVNVKYIFITSGPTKKYAQEAIEKAGFLPPVYYEKEYFSFKTINNLPKADRLYNTMLLNNNKVILFGEIFQNEKAEKLFFNTIQSCTAL
jgi:hypothetical protein